MKTSHYLLIGFATIALATGAAALLKPRTAAVHTSTVRTAAQATGQQMHMAGHDGPGAMGTPATTTGTASGRPRNLFTEVHCPENVSTQHFRVNARRDTVLTTAHGCVLRVRAGSFANADGSTVKGSVDLHLQEVLDPVDYVMGNMLTMYKGRPLESGGSFNITACANGSELQLAKGRTLDMGVPTRLVKKGMGLYPGDRTETGVRWLDPEPMQAPVADTGVDTVAFQEPSGWVAATEEWGDRKTNAMYWVEGFKDPNDAPDEVGHKVSEVCFAGKGLWLKRDSTFRVGRHMVHLVVSDTITRAAFPPAGAWDAVQLVGFEGTGQDQGSVKGTNTFRVDPTANYVFQVKRLGWANIDRLCNDKLTKPVDIITRVDAPEELGDVYITMVVKSHGMFIPGYQKQDGTYCFSHGDYEKMQLPIGMKATILATAYKDGKPWFAMKQIKISEKDEVALELVPGTKEGLRTALEKNL